MWLCRLKRLLLCFFPWIRFLTSARFWFIIFILCWLSPWLATRNFASHNVSQKLSIYFGFVQKWVVVFFLGNSLSTTSQFQCSAFFHHRKSVIRFVFVICNHAVCISIKWWTKKSNRIKRTPHSYTEPHTHKHRMNPKRRRGECGKCRKGKGDANRKSKDYNFYSCFCVLDWLCFGESLYFRFDGYVLYVCVMVTD